MSQTRHKDFPPTKTAKWGISMNSARLGIVFLIAVFASAQQTLPPNAPSASRAELEKEIKNKEQSQRILGIVPMFGVTSRQNAPPLTPGEKLHLFVRSSVDPFGFVVVGIQAGIGQATDAFPTFGQGAAGYGKRYGAALADGVSSNFFSNFFYPVLLKEDPRYFRLGEGNVKRRIGYSLSRVVICHKDSGGRTFNFSNVLGALSAGGVSNAYYPPSDRGFGLTMSRAGISLIYGSAGGLLNEFWPDIRKAVLHKRGNAD
jgi:hypothetical protein